MKKQTNEQPSQEVLTERLQSFGGKLLKLAGEQAKSRAKVEQRWLKDMRQFHGEYTEEERQRFKDADTSELYVNITRNKTNGAEARLQDMLFPTDDRNWGIRPTPVPSMGEASDSESPEAQELRKQAKAAAEAMTAQIDDQLNESKYAVKARDAIHDAAQLGTGILKGPVIVGRSKKIWQVSAAGDATLEISEDLAPSVERVDPWNFYPDMSAKTIDEAEFIFERHLWTKKQLRKFAKLPGVLKQQLKNLVRGQTQGQTVAKDHTDDIRAITGVDVVSDDNRYEVWEYHGPISKSVLTDAMDVSGYECGCDNLDDLDDEVDAVVFFSDRQVLKVTLNAMDTDEWPYSIFNWEKDESTIFGFGVPYLMRNAQKVINAAWRMMMDNAGASVSDIIVANREIIEPADGRWSSVPGKKKLYFLTDKTKNVSEAFASFTIPNHQGELGAILTMARQLADEETNLPLIAQGEQAAHVTKTSSGMAMLMNSANIVLRRAVKNWDDDVTSPQITRFYDWNMQFNERADIKGDQTIDARGSSVLLVREKQQENLMIYANISAANPEFAIRRDWRGMDKEIAKSLEVPHDKLTLDEAEVEERQRQQAEAQGNQGDPTVELKMAELQLKQQDQQMRLQIEQQRLEIEAQFKSEQLELQRELEMAKLAAAQQTTIAQLQAQIGMEERREQNKRDIAAGTLTLKQTETQLKATNLAQGHDTYG